MDGNTPRRWGAGGQEERENGATAFASSLSPAPQAGNDYSLVEHPAIAFLETWQPGGPWVLTSIIPDKKPEDKRATTTRTFFGNEVAEMRDWLRERHGVENLYFTVNPTRTALNSKAKKTDVRGVIALHVDVDPRAGERSEDERERALRVLQEFSPPPTVIIDSGGGFQGFWKLAEEQEATDESRIAELEAYNLAIEVALQADSCHNIDRIMRLPGTVNLPNEKKRKKGRTAAPTSVVEADWSRRYRLSDLPSAPPVMSSGGAARQVVSLPDDRPRLESLDDLLAAVKDRTKALIVQGDDPDDPTKYPSRSEALFAVCCDLVRAGCTDDQIAAVILDPDYGISASVLGKKQKAREYAARQIGRAREQAGADPQLLDLNRTHAWLTHEGGKVRIVQFVREQVDADEHDPDRQQWRWIPYTQSYRDFEATFSNRQVVVSKDKNGKEKTVGLGTAWRQWEHRKTHRCLTFDPKGGEVVGDKLNLWRGFGVQEKQGDWSLMHAHIRDIVADGNPDVDLYIRQWLALAVQKPETPAGVALVLQGGRGAGKGIFAHFARALFGQHGFYLSGATALTSRFNAHLGSTVLLYADEVKWNGNRNAESLLQAIITEPEILVEPKYKDAVLSKNRLHLIISSNDDWVVPAGLDERRFAVFAPSAAKAGPEHKPYFDAIAAQMTAGGLAAMLYDLRRMDLTGFNPREYPRTVNLTHQKLEGLDSLNRIVMDMLLEGFAPYGVIASDRADPVVTVPAILKWGRDRGYIQGVTPGNLKMANALKKMGIERGKFWTDGRERWGWGLPPLAEARACWAESLGLDGMEWPEKEEWDSFPPAEGQTD